MKPPAYVSMVMSPSIRLQALDHAARTAIQRSGLLLSRVDGQPAVRFNESEGELLSNPDFVDALSRLNAAGLVFCEDYKQGWAPADLMRELQSRGRISVPFLTIAWQGPGDWFTTLHSPGQPPQRIARPTVSATTSIESRPWPALLFLLGGTLVALGALNRPEPLPEQSSPARAWLWIVILGAAAIVASAWWRFASRNRD